MTSTLDQYRTTGYVTTTLLDHTDVTALLAVADAVQQQAAGMTRSHGDFNLETRDGGYAGQDGTGGGSDGYTGVLRKVSRAADHSPLIAEVSRRPRLTAFAGQLLGGVTLELAHSVLWYKPAQVGSPKPPHQDAPYLDGDPQQYVTIWIALDECTPDNGCLQVVAGSHRQGVIEHTGAERQIDAETWCQAGPIPVLLLPGEAIAFHPCLLHGSEPNRSARARRALMLRYRDAQATDAG
jgi:ectoine hydroxylase-related dioxygenase (phytanoyl-CoA dioxygenase family)